MMHHLSLLKVGLSLVGSLSGHGSSPQGAGELALDLLKRLAKPKPRHCEVCHEANARLLHRLAA
jgi:hypothetical protein